jgi:hypothetical protein
MLHFDNLLSNFMSDFDAISNNFQQLIAPTRDSTPDHDILWPQQGPDPVFPIEQRDKDPDHIILWPRHGPDPAEQPSIQRCFAILSSSQADAKLATNDHSALPFCVGTYIRQLFDPGGSTDSKRTFPTKIIDMILARQKCKRNNELKFISFYTTKFNKPLPTKETQDRSERGLTTEITTKDGDALVSQTLKTSTTRTNTNAITKMIPSNCEIPLSSAADPHTYASLLSSRNQAKRPQQYYSPMLSRNIELLPPSPSTANITNTRQHKRTSNSTKVTDKNNNAKTNLKLYLLSHMILLVNHIFYWHSFGI